MAKKNNAAFVQTRHREFNTFDSRVYKGENGRIGVYVDTHKRASFICRFAIRMSMVKHGIDVPTFTRLFNKAYSANLKESHVTHVFLKLQKAGIMSFHADGWKVSPKAVEIFKSLHITRIN